MTQVPKEKIVLLIEDDVDVRETVAAVLMEEGYTLDCAPNGLIGLDLLRSRRPGVILLDLMMPVLNGWQFRQAQRADTRVSDVPVVVLSADHAGPREAEKMDAQGFIEKPISIDDLVGVVGSFFQRV